MTLLTALTQTFTQTGYLIHCFYLYLVWGHSSKHKTTNRYLSKNLFECVTQKVYNFLITISA